MEGDALNQIVDKIVLHSQFHLAVQEFEMLAPKAVIIESPDGADAKYNYTYWSRFGNPW